MTAIKKNAPQTAATVHSAKIIKIHPKNSTKRPLRQGRHFDNFPSNSPYLDEVGGEERVAVLRPLMEQAEKELAPCPFCGEAAVMDGVFSYYVPGIRVQCPRCHIGTVPYCEGAGFEKGYTLEECVEIAAKNGIGERRNENLHYIPQRGKP